MAEWFEVHIWFFDIMYRALLVFYKSKYIALDTQNKADPEKASLLHSAGPPTSNGVLVYGNPVASVNRQ